MTSGDTILNSAELSMVSPEIVVDDMDLMLPAGGGLAVYDRVKKSPESQNIPILFLSAASVQELKGRFLTIDRKFFIPKPWDNEELLATIKEILDNHAPGVGGKPD